MRQTTKAMTMGMMMVVMVMVVRDRDRGRDSYRNSWRIPILAESMRLTKSWKD